MSTIYFSSALNGAGVLSYLPTLIKLNHLGAQNTPRNEYKT